MCGAVAVSAHAGTVAQQPVRKATSVVRADTRTGRLVRTVVVPAKPIAPKVVAAQPVQDSTVSAEAPISGPSNIDPDINQLVEKAAKQYDVDPLLVHSVIQVESNYNPYALSPKGAQGLMQLIPSTARRFGVKNTFDAKDNIEGGVKYLKYLKELFPNDLRLALAAYNAGEAAVAKYNNNIPPYRETEYYVYKVGEKYGSAVRARKQAAAVTSAAPANNVAKETYAPIQQYMDADGRLYLRTRPVASDTP